MAAELYLVLDVESVGLHGEGFAWGGLVIDHQGQVLEERLCWTDPDNAQGSDDGREWVREHARDNLYEEWPDQSVGTTREVREQFWTFWRKWAEQGAVMVGDCAWPVEARFLLACQVDFGGTEDWNGPFPLHEVATSQLLADMSITERGDRRPNEKPEHNPLMDARQSARKFGEARKLVRTWQTDTSTWERRARDAERDLRSQVTGRPVSGR